MGVAVVPVDAPPRRRFRHLARESAIYASGAVAGKAVGLLLLPIVTRMLGPGDYGRLDVLTTLHSAATSVLLLGLDTGATRLYADLDDRGRRRLFGTWLVITALVVVPFATTLVALREPISSALFGTDAYATSVALVAWSIAAATTQLVALTALRNQRRPSAFATVSAGTLVLNGVLVVALLTRDASVTSVMASLAISLSVGAVVGLAVAGRRTFGDPESAMGRRLLHLGLPLLPAVAATWVAEFVNRAILLTRAGPVEVGYFSVAARFASVALLVVIGFQNAWQPQAFADGEDDPDALRRIADDGLRIIVSVAAAVIALATVSPELVRLAAGDQFAAALPAVGLSLVFALGLAAYHVATMPSALSRRMRDLGLAAGVAAVSGVVLNLWWARTWGAAGTAAAVAVGQFTGVGVGYALSRTQAAVPYDRPRLLGVVLVATSTAVIATLPTGGAPLGVRLALLVAAGVLLARMSGAFSGLAPGPRRDP